MVNLPLIRYCGTPEEAARPVEEVLDYVPGECWAQLLPSPCAAILVKELLRVEVLGLPRPLYSQVFIYFGCFPFKVQAHCFQSSGAEPGSYSHLTEASVLRGLVNFLQANSQLSLHPSHHCQGFSPPCLHHLPPSSQAWTPSSSIGLDLPGFIARVCHAQVGLG